MLNYAQFKNFYRHYSPLVWAVLFCIALLSGRVAVTQTKVYLFLAFNLFLAFLPFVFSYRLRADRPSLLNLAKALLCILFLPNAPYIFTDLFHLREGHESLLWLDTLLIGSFAWAGLLFYFYSLQNLERFMRPIFSNGFIQVVLGFISFLSGFGIYIGRYLRFNSWDILSNPFSLFYEMLQIFVQPVENKLAWAITLSYGLFLVVVYQGFRLKKLQQPVWVGE
jgi:uncharacterized membrane protein